MDFCDCVYMHAKPEPKSNPALPESKYDRACSSCCSKRQTGCGCLSGSFFLSVCLRLIVYVCLWEHAECVATYMPMYMLAQVFMCHVLTST